MVGIGGRAGGLRLIGLNVFIGRNLLCPYPAVAGELEVPATFQGFPEPDAGLIQARFNELFADFGPPEPTVAIAEQNGPGDVAALLVAWLTRALQNFGGASVSECGFATEEAGRLHALSAYQSPGFAKSAMRIAFSVVADLADSRLELGRQTLAPAVHKAVANLMQLRKRAHVDHHTGDVLAFARGRGIPWHFMPASGLVQLGDGIKQRFIGGTMDDRSSHLGALICHDKFATAEVLKRIGLPTTAPIRAENAAAAEIIAERIGYPVVIKPSFGKEGAGITVDVTRREKVQPAFAFATAANFGPVLVEKFAPGDDHRLLVVDGRLVAAAKRVPAYVTGDGCQSIEALIAIANRDPRRGSALQSRPMERLVIDDEMERVLQRRGYGLADVPSAGETVRLRGTANISTGGSAFEVTDIVHPGVRAIAELAARALRVNVLGVDYITSDISRPPGEVPGVICEVNEWPGLRPHWLAGTSRERYLGPLLDRMFPAGDSGRIPRVGVTGGRQAGPIATMVAAMLQASGVTTGLAGSAGVSVGGRILQTGNAAGGEAARLPFIDPDAEAAVIELDNSSLARAGLPFDRCDVAAVVGETEAATAAGVDAARLHALVTSVATRAVVLDADHPRLDLLAAPAPAPICLVSLSEGHKLVEAHIAAGGPACVVEGQGGDAKIVCYSGDGTREVLGRVCDIGGDGSVAEPAINVLFAAAIVRQTGIRRVDARAATRIAGRR